MAADGHRPERIYLVGFMGAGKTSVGVALAAKLGYGFVDLDQEVEGRAGTSVREIFERRGEDAFRELEHRLLAETSARRRVVVATGGGAFTFERNRELIRRSGTSVWLNPDFDTLLARLDRAGRTSRPLFRDPEGARRLHRRRLGDYRRADLELRIDSDETAEEVAGKILDSLEGEV